MAKTYNVIPACIDGEMRYIVTDLSGTVIDDANGYGYKTKTTAHRGYSYKRKHDMI